MSNQGIERLALDMPPATAYAIRAWYTVILGQTQAVRQDLLVRIENAEAEVNRLREQVRRSDASIDALERVVDTVDDWIRRLTARDDGTNDTNDTAGPSGPRRGGSRRRAQGREGSSEETEGGEQS